jgi:dephospho-CoA kinase
MPERDPSPPSAPARTLVIGVLGGIASGKSAVAALLAGPEGVVIDADELAHEALAREEVAVWARRRLGAASVAGGRVVRSELAARVFAEPELRRELEALVHPHVRSRIRARLADARARGVPRAVLDVPLLLENEAEHGFVAACDVLVFVEADARVRRERAIARSWPPGELERREAAQLPLESKRARADYLVLNDGSLEELRARAGEVLAAIEGLRRPPP